MKKLILTESQLENLKSFLNEEEQEQEHTNIDDYIDDVKKQFVNSIGKHNEGDYVTFLFGELTEDFSFPEKTKTIIFKFLKFTGKTCLLSFVGSDEDTPFVEGNNYLLYAQGVIGIHKKDSLPQIGFTPVDEEGNKNGSRILVPEFLSYLITSEDNKTNSEEVKRVASEKWKERNDKFNQEMYLKPGMLGMDNFFVFGTGTKAMDATLKKLGMGII